MPEKRKKTATRESLSNQVKDLQLALLTMGEHVDQLQNQQLMQHVELTALKQLLAEGRPIVMETFNKRCEIVLQSVLQKVNEDEQQSVPEGESEGSDTAPEGLVEPAHEISAR